MCRIFLHMCQFSSVAQLCSTFCDPMNRSTPGLPVHHQLPEFTQTHVHRVADGIQPSHPLSSPSPPAPNPSQLWRSANPKSHCRQTAWRLRMGDGSDKAWRQSRGEFPLALTGLFILVKSLTDWMRPTHIMVSSLFYSRFTDINVSLIPKHLPSWQNWPSHRYN